MEQITDLRIYAHHSLNFSRGEQVTIHFEGKKLKAFANETLAAALYASGIRVMSRSMKYHRPRGLFCLSGKCASCRMRVNGVPGVRTCRTWCEDGMVVLREKTLGNASSDLLFASDFIFRDRLDYHHLLPRPALLNRLLLYGVRHMAGMGALPDEAAPSPPIRDINSDVAVIGAGPAGCEAALAASEAGCSVILVEEDRSVGGHLGSWPEKIREGGSSGIELAAEYDERLNASKIIALKGTTAFAYYPEGFLALADERGIIRLKAKKYVLAVGGYDRNLMVPGNDLPNVFSSRALLKLVNRFGIRPGSQAFLVGTSDRNLSLALSLSEIGIRIVGISEDGPTVRGSEQFADEIQSRGIPIFFFHKPISAIGRSKLKGFVIGPSDGGRERVRIECDVVAVDLPSAPAWELAAQMGCEINFSRQAGGFAVKAGESGRTTNTVVFAVGEMLGSASSDELMEQGRLVGAAAAAGLQI